MLKWTHGNKITLLEGGDVYFALLESAIREAKHEIYFFTYIYIEDQTGARMAAALMDAAKRGVSVCVVVDGVGSFLSRAFMERMREAGVKLKIFRALSRVFSLGPLSLRRLHQKVVVIDSQTAFVGGMNITDQHLAGDNYWEMLDFSVKVEGPLVFEIRRFARLFFFRLNKQWTDYMRSLIEARRELSTTGPMEAAFAIRDNFYFRRDIETAYLKALRRAKSRVLIANAYFLPGRRLRKQLMKAARRGVRVRLLLQGRAEFPFLQAASRYLYKELLDAGIEIFEYHERILHAKVAVVDGDWSTVGSCNFDAFSFFLNLEANVIIRDEEFATKLGDRLEALIKAGAQQIHHEIVQRTPLLSRLRSRLALWVFRMFSWFK